MRTVKSKNQRLMFRKQLKPKAVESIKRKIRSISVENFRLNPKGKWMSMMLVSLKIPNKLNLVQNRNYVIRIGDGILFLHRCRFHHMDHSWLCHGELISVCLIRMHHGFITYICRFSLRICAQIMLPIGNRWLVNHHLPIMTVLFRKIGLCRKRNTRWSNKFIVSKKMDG